MYEFNGSEVEGTMLMDDIDISYEDIRMDMDIIDDSMKTVSMLESQIATEESIINDDVVNKGTVALSIESLKGTMDSLGLDYNDSELSIEESYLPSTQVDMNADQRKSINSKKKLISKIMEAIKSVFKKLYIKASKLYAKIAMLLNNNKKALAKYIKKIKANKWDSVVTLPDEQLRLSKRAGMYYVFNGEKFDTQLLQILMYDRTLISAAYDDLISLSKMKQFDASKIKKDIILRANSALEHPPLLATANKFVNILKQKDAMKTLAYGKIISFSPTAINVLSISETESDDIMATLASRKFVTNTVSLPMGRVLTPATFGKYDKKEHLIDFLTDLSEIVNDFEKYTSELDKFVDNINTVYKQMDKAVVGEASGVMKASMTMYNKLLLDLSTVKRITVVKTINSLVGVGGVYANATVK